jgi:hypothetical protein
MILISLLQSACNILNFKSDPSRSKETLIPVRWISRLLIELAFFGFAT